MTGSADPWFLALLPVVGLCSCGGPAAVASVSPSESPSRPPLLIEQFDVEPLTVEEAMVRSGREALARGDYDAATETFALALASAPDLDDELRVARIDAALGRNDLAGAELLLAEAWDGAQSVAEHRELASRAILARERANDMGFATCEAKIDSQRASLVVAPDALAAWHVVRAGLSSRLEVAVPADQNDATTVLCERGCSDGEPTLVQIADEAGETTMAMVVAQSDGTWAVLPELLHASAGDCGEDTRFAVEHHDGLVRVRAFGDQLRRVDPGDWNLVELPSYATAPTVVTPSYASSGYYGPPSPPSSYSYGCGGGYHYSGSSGGYETQSECVVGHSIERDVFLDLERGEVVLDIVRTGGRGSALGRVSMPTTPTGPTVEVRACGVSERLSL